MLKLALILSAASMTACLTIARNKAFHASKHTYSFGDEDEPNAGYYLVFERPEETHFDDSKAHQEMVYESQNHHDVEEYGAGGGSSSSFHDGGAHFEYSEDHKSGESPKIEYILVHSNEGDEYHRSDYGQGRISHFPENSEDKKKEEEKVYYEHPKYKYVYGVQDYHTGDVKSHEESRDGDQVKGWYSLLEPDGTVLEVHYMVDKKSGFNARVDRKGKAVRSDVRKKSY